MIYSLSNSRAAELLPKSSSSLVTDLLLRFSAVGKRAAVQDVQTGTAVQLLFLEDAA